MNFLAILIICGIIGGLVGKILNYRVPDSVAGCIIASCIGAALGYEFLPHFGPILFGFSISPALIGSVIFIIIISTILITRKKNKKHKKDNRRNS
ncbi:hypothetical protein AST01_04570 [Staphylococcus equorum]|uniref:hypothetical protein n=1 Tax=Staphylococcus equorum TaxID=246432 RepID=UPI000852BAAB|nr:hypothetical protein [Staphylococcus equorum]OEK70205.1 hypothetical protein AST01_04570 [Staphylococcus equorum]